MIIRDIHFTVVFILLFYVTRQFYSHARSVHAITSASSIAPGFLRDLILGSLPYKEQWVMEATCP